MCKVISGAPALLLQAMQKMGKVFMSNAMTCDAYLAIKNVTMFHFVYMQLLCCLLDWTVIVALTR